MRESVPTRLVYNSLSENYEFLSKLEQYMPLVATIHRYLEKSEVDGTGWVQLPLEPNVMQLDLIQQFAAEIKKQADVLVVIGVGGSYIGSSAIQEALSPYFGKNNDGVEVMYVGQNMSGAYIQQLLKSLDNKEVYVNVISKSGTTLEPALAFRVMKQFMQDRYGDAARNRIIVTTDAKEGLLTKMASNLGFRQLNIPSNIGGRFSVLTPVGLLPLAASGVNILTLLEGAKQAAIQLSEENLSMNAAYQYAVIRHLLYKKGYQLELLATFEPRLAKFQEWWKQLFGESEGKEGKGIFPGAVTYSTDLHSLGQFVQEGSRILFETFLNFKEIEEDYVIPKDYQNLDGLDYLSNRSFNEINTITKQGTISAHLEGGVPIIQIEVARLDAFHIGYLLYFFMKACAMSAYLLEVNPFNQPGVLAYKSKMQSILVQEHLVK